MGDHERGKLDDSGFTMTAVQAVLVDAMEEAEVHREEVAVEMVCG